MVKMREAHKRKPEKMCSGKRGKSAMAVEGVKSEIMKIPNPSDSGQHYARIAPVERIRTGRTKEIQITNL